MSSHRLLSRSLTTGLAAAALAASSAAAMGPPQQPIHVSEQERQVLASRGQGAPEPTPGPVSSVAPKAKAAGNDGFDWGSAGIGAGTAGGLTLLALGSIGLAHRRHTSYAR